VTLRHALTILAVEDLPRAREFYRAALGVEPAVSTPVYAELALGTQRIGVYQREGFGRNTGRAPMEIPAGEFSPCELYLYADDLEAAMARVEAAGARALDPRRARPWGDEVAYYADPDGHVLALARTAALSLDEPPPAPPRAAPSR